MTKLINKPKPVVVRIGVVVQPGRVPIQPNRYKTFPTGKARVSGKKSGKINTGKLARILQKKYKVFSRAFENPDKNTLEVVKQVIRLYFNEGNAKIKSIESGFSSSITTPTIENGFLALIRNPILKRRFGSNSLATQKNKGFNFPLVDTGQFFRSIQVQILEKKR